MQLSDSALAAMATSRAHIDALVASSEPVYGVSTGFGALANRYVSVEQRAQLQRSLIRSHAAGVGAPVEREVVRALMTLRLKTLASGRTGVRPVVATTMAAVLPTALAAFSSARSPKTGQPEKVLILVLVIIFDDQT